MLIKIHEHSDFSTAKDGKTWQNPIKIHQDPWKSLVFDCKWGVMWRDVKKNPSKSMIFMYAILKDLQDGGEVSHLWLAKTISLHQTNQCDFTNKHGDILDTGWLVSNTSHFPTYVRQYVPAWLPRLFDSHAVLAPFVWVNYSDLSATSPGMNGECKDSYPHMAFRLVNYDNRY